MILDFHNHFYPPEFIAAVRKGPSNFTVTDDDAGNQSGSAYLFEVPEPSTLTLTFMGILGLLALSGIVINNAIVLIDRIDQEREDGRPLHEAIIEAGVRRFQPIIMTTCTTAMGLLPIIISRDVLFYDLAVVIAGGLLVGTLLTLVVVPCLYAICYGERPSLPKLWRPVNQTVEPTAG